MSRLKPDKLHVRFLSEPDSGHNESVSTRCYTLTHSDRTGDLYLTIGSCYDHKQVSDWYTRFMRDEVLAKWREEDGHPSLHVHCHVSGGFIFGPPSMRYAIFRRELPLVLEAIRHGDYPFFAAHPDLDHAPIHVHFHAKQACYQRVEDWGSPSAYHHPETSERASG